MERKFLFLCSFILVLQKCYSDDKLVDSSTSKCCGVGTDELQQLKNLLLELSKEVRSLKSGIKNSCSNSGTDTNEGNYYSLF